LPAYQKIGRLLSEKIPPDNQKIGPNSQASNGLNFHKRMKKHDLRKTHKSCLWRRRESNPNLIRRNELQRNDLQKVDSGQSAYLQHTTGSTGHDLAFADATLERLIAVWSALPRHIQQTIVTLLDAAT
jgi:hypothetical protein